MWAATARFFGLPVSGYDRYSSGTGEMRWRLLGVVPVLSAAGPDVTRSAAGRLAAEAMFVPTTFDLASWADGPAPEVARRSWRVGDIADAVDLHVAADGTLRAVTMERWQGGKAPAQRRPFGVTTDAEHRFCGLASRSGSPAGGTHPVTGTSSAPKSPPQHSASRPPPFGGGRDEFVQDAQVGAVSLGVTTTATRGWPGSAP